MNIVTSTFCLKNNSYTTCSEVGNSTNSTNFLAHKRAKEFTANLFTVEISGFTAGGRLEALKLRYTGVSSHNTLDTGTSVSGGVRACI